MTHIVHQYAEQVMSGKIVAGPHVRNQCKRHLADLKRDGIYFDEGAADRVIDFFAEVLRLSEGQFEGIPFDLHISQAFIVGSLFGWKLPDGTRRYRRAYIEMGKGNCTMLTDECLAEALGLPILIWLNEAAEAFIALEAAVKA